MLSLVSSAPVTMVASVQFHNEKLFKTYEKEVEELHASMDKLRELFKQIPEIPAKDLAELDKSIEAILNVTASIAEKRHDVDSFNSIEKMENFQTLLVKSKEECYLHLEAMSNSAIKMTENAQNKLNHTQHNQVLILNIGLALNIIMGLFLSSFFRQGILNRINVIAKNTERLAKGEELLPAIGGSDEIAQFDRAFHTMLEQLQNAAKNEQELFDNASDVICVLDENNFFVRVNPASLKDWGLAPESLVGTNLKALLSETDFEIAAQAIKQSKETGNASTFETAIETQERGKLAGLWSVYWSEEEQRLFGIIHDQSESKQIEKSRQRFLAMISSDLKLPLNRIAAAFNKLSEELMDLANKQAKDKLEMTRKNIRRLLSLVNDLLAVTQIDSGKFELNPCEVERKQLLSHASADLEALADNKDISFQIECEEGYVFADSDRTIQVLVNLLSNAIKFSPGKSVIQVTCQTDRENADLVIFKVIDKGRGVPAQHKEAIFEKFSQVELADGKRKAGTGLGLPICKQIVEKQFGQIGVESVEGEGSTFWFTLPKNPAAQERLEEEKQKPLQTALRQTRVNKIPLARAAAVTMPAMRSSGLMFFLDKLTLAQKGTLLVAIPVVVELSLALMLSSSLTQMEEERAEELHMRAVATTASTIAKFILYGSGSVVNSAQNFRWNRFRNSLHAIKKEESNLEGLIEDDPYATKEYEKFLHYSDKLEKFSHDLVKQKLENSDEGVASMLREKMKQIPALLATCKHLRNLVEHAEHFEFTSPEKELNTRTAQFSFLFIALFLNISFSVLLAILFSVGVSKRILIMADNAARLANDDSLNPVMEGKDELAALDLAFHQTARALSEARKKERAVFDNCQDVLCIVAPSGQFVGINAAVESNWGYPRKEFLNSSLEAVVEAEDLKECKKALLGDSKQNGVLIHESRVKKADGSLIHVLWSASRKSGQENTFCVVRDITAKKELEELRQEFLAMVSHDLRTPLTAINGIAQLIQAGVFGAVSDRADEPLNTIRINVSALLELISDILDLEKLSAGKMELNTDFVLSADLLQSVNDQLNKGLVGRCLAPPVTLTSVSLNDKTIKIDKDRLTSALINLARFLYLQSGKNTNLELAAKALGQSKLEIQILDSGPALSEKQCNELFLQEREPWPNEALLREENFHADLLLPLAKKTIESHGGSVSITRLDNKRNAICVSLAVESLVADKIVN